MKNNSSLLECTLRDGGYITGWQFSEDMIKNTIQSLVEANFDFVEVGYLYHKPYIEGSTQFQTIEQIGYSAVFAARFNSTYGKIY